MRAPLFRGSSTLWRAQRATKNHPLSGWEALLLRNRTPPPLAWRLFRSSCPEGKVIAVAQKANSLAHTKWLCKYHIVFAPKYRRKVIYNPYRKGTVKILAHFPTAPRPAIRCGYPSSSVTSR